MSAQETAEVTTETQPQAEVVPQTEQATEEVKQEGQEGEQAEESQERDEKGRFKPNRVQERIDELTRKAGEAAREAAYYRGLHEASQPKAEPVKTEDPGKPKLEQFQNYEEYTEALTDWKIEQRESKREAETRQRETATTWNQRTQAARGAIPDFDAVLSTSTAPMSKAMAEAIQLSEKGPELAYQLAKNPGEAQRIAQLPHALAAMELGKLEASLSAPKPTPRVTTAPAPANTIGQGRSTESDPGKMSMDEYMTWRKTQSEGKR